MFPTAIKGRERNDFYDDKHIENMVVFECVDRLLMKGYHPEHIELEKEWHLGHDPKGGRADICITDPEGQMLIIVECKTFGEKYEDEMANMLNDGGQLFSYWQQEKATRWLCIYASTFQDGQLHYHADCISCKDTEEKLSEQAKGANIRVFKESHSAEELFKTWDETYEKEFVGDVIFNKNSGAYEVNVQPIKKSDLKDFTQNDRIINRFEEILRHNNVSDKENAFNRLLALFICKLVDEYTKSDDDIMDFQYKPGDTHEILQDRLQRLHKEGMAKFMDEEVFYIPEDYAEKTLSQYKSSERKNLIAELNETLRKLKYYTNNDFAFKDVHNEELFKQNGRIVKEMVQLFEGYRLVGSEDLQTLGNMFENLLDQGFRQNEGQFFTPVPITRFIWECLPLDSIMEKEGKSVIPRVVDFACGAGHFLSEGYREICEWMDEHNPGFEREQLQESFYGVEKDYRLARTSKIAMFMHGMGKANIIFGDGLENYNDAGVKPNSFDILVSNPPFSVKSFNQYLKLENNLTVLSLMSEKASQIELAFVERATQMVKSDGHIAIILPAGVLFRKDAPYIAIRKMLLDNFYIDSIIELPSGTFGKTGTNTDILFLHRYIEPPDKSKLIDDCVNNIINVEASPDWEDVQIKKTYISEIELQESEYDLFLQRTEDYTFWNDKTYFATYYKEFIKSTEFKTRIKTKSFSKLTPEEQKGILNKLFYNKYIALEKEKLHYFGLIYKHEVLIASCGDSNKEVKEFLGYEWNDARGSEGLVMLNPGGKLYDPSEKHSPNKLAGIIYRHLSKETVDLSAMSDYVVAIPLYKIIDFKDTNLKLEINTGQAAMPITIIVDSVETIVDTLEQLLVDFISAIKDISFATAVNISSGVVNVKEVFKKLTNSRFTEMFINNAEYKTWPSMLMEDVCDVITDGSHHSPEETDSGYPMLSVKDMYESDFDYTECKYISQKDYDELVKNGCKPVKGDVLIAKDGSYFRKGLVVREEKEQVILSSIAILRPKKDLMNPDYLVRFLLSDKVLSTVSSMTTGTALKRVILEKFKRMKISVPPLDLQNKFVEYANLVEKSKALFEKMVLKLDELVLSRIIEKYGTVEEPKVKFEELGNIATYVNGYAFKPSDWGTEGLPIIRIQNLSGSGDSFNYYDGEYPKEVEINSGDIMISWSATVGVFKWDGPKAILNQHIFKVNFDKIDINPVFFRVAVAPALYRATSQMHGSTMTHLTKKAFDRIRMPLPDKSEQDQFASFVEQVDAVKSDLVNEIKDVFALKKTPDEFILFAEKELSAILNTIKK